MSTFWYSITISLNYIALFNGYIKDVFTNEL